MIPRNALAMSCLIPETLEQIESPAMACYERLMLAGWRFYIVGQDRGYCRGSEKIITVPSWLWKQEAIFGQLGATMCKQTKLNYRVWYICHEMAHAIDFLRNGKLSHDPSFMQCLKEICPPEAIGYESGYQTKTALACGIAPDDF